ncbi:hypothetical protein ACHQM5_016997 [Ranunculus cassubicifolius]
MAAKPLTSEAIALTEKKMDMTLEEIIKMNKKPAAKAAKVTKATNHRTSNKSQKPLNTSAAQGNSSKLRRYMDSRSSMIRVSPIHFRPINSLRKDDLWLINLDLQLPLVG